jgi:hypothetical protein
VLTGYHYGVNQKLRTKLLYNALATGETIVTVRDPNILSNLDPKAITTYLKARGWMRESHIREKESVWVNSTNDQEYDEYDITLPLNRTTRSYALRMSEILLLGRIGASSYLKIIFTPNGADVTFYNSFAI